MFIIYVDNNQPFWIVSLFLTDKKVSRVLVCSTIFYYSNKLISESVLSFVLEMKLNVQEHLAFGKSTISRTQVQLWYNRFNEGQEDINNNARPDRPSTSTTD